MHLTSYLTYRWPHFNTRLVQIWVNFTVVYRVYIGHFNHFLLLYMLRIAKLDRLIIQHNLSYKILRNCWQSNEPLTQWYSVGDYIFVTLVHVGLCDACCLTAPSHYATQHSRVASSVDKTHRCFFVNSTKTLIIEMQLKCIFKMMVV